MPPPRAALVTALAALLCAAAWRPASAAAPPSLDLDAVDGLFSWHAPGGWDAPSSTWADASGNGRDAFAGVVAAAAAGGDAAELLGAQDAPGAHGAGNAVTYVAGSAGATLQFGNDPLPANFSICSVTRFPARTGDAVLLPGNASAPWTRVLSSTVGLWTHGHDRGLAGVAGTCGACLRTLTPRFLHDLSHTHAADPPCGSQATTSRRTRRAATAWGSCGRGSRA
jgi:hypothetical protein